MRPACLANHPKPLRPVQFAVDVRVHPDLRWLPDRRAKEVIPLLWIAFALVFAGFLGIQAIDRYRRTNR